MTQTWRDLPKHGSQLYACPGVNQEVSVLGDPAPGLLKAGLASKAVSHSCTCSLLRLCTYAILLNITEG